VLVFDTRRIGFFPLAGFWDWGNGWLGNGVKERSAVFRRVALGLVWDGNF